MNGRESGEEVQDFIRGMERDSLNSRVFRLIHRYGSLNFSKFQKLGVHPRQLPVFAILQRNEGVSLREMADLLHIKPPTVTVTIQRLEKAGFVIKKPDGKDQRINRIYLTEKGKNLGEEIQDLLLESEQILTGGFSQEELGRLKVFLDRMIRNLVQASEGSCGGAFPDEECGGEHRREGFSRSESSGEVCGSTFSEGSAAEKFAEGDFPKRAAPGIFRTGSNKKLTK